MNTKTSYNCAHNYYDGGNHGPGRDSPGALLDMLAEVASQTLHSESIHTATNITTKIKQKADPVKRKTQQVYLNLAQILSMPLTQLVKHFAVFTSDELRRQYSYVCALVPGCQQKYTSFASEGKARICITAHLSDHLDDLKNNEDSYSTFKAAAVKFTKPKSGISNKKHKLQQCKKPQETPNKENKLIKSEKSTSYLRKILCNEMNFKDFEKHNKLEDANCAKESIPYTNETENDKTDIGLESKVLVDHCYYESVKAEPIANERPEENVDNGVVPANIMLMVVQSDGVHVTEVPYISDDMTGQSQPEDNVDHGIDEIQRVISTHVASASLPGKPKGKAKFIGTSKEEREMALVLIDRIKKKGNPTGSNLQCRICDPPRSFTASTTLVSHYRSHAGIKPYECRICRSVFTRRHSLKYHMLIHQNLTRFTCADCGKKFRHPSHFREHRRRHTGESPFGCEDCGQRFKTRNTYKRHLKTRHGKVLTTTGELLRLTEEEFQKVQTNRKRKSQSLLLSDVSDEKDAAVIDTLVPYENDIEDNQENNNYVMMEGNEDYDEQVDESVTPKSHDAKLSAVTDKTEIIETEVKLENTCFIDQQESINDHNRVLYEDCIVEEDHSEYVNSPIEIIHRLKEEKKNVYEAVQADDDDNDNCGTENEYMDVVVEYNDNPPDVDENELVVPYECDATDDDGVDDYSENEPNITADYQRATMEHSEQENKTTRLNVQYAYKIQGNVRYRLQVIPQETAELFDNSQNQNEQCSSTANIHVERYDNDTQDIDCHNNNNKNETEDTTIFSAVADSTEAQVDQMDEAINNVSTADNTTFLVLSNEDFKTNGYLRIDSKNIVLREVSPLPSLAVPQK